MIAKEPSLCNQIGSISLLFSDLKAEWLQKNRPFAIKKELYFCRVGGVVVEKESGKSRLDENKLRLKQTARESWVDVSPQFSMRGSWRLANNKETADHIS